MELEDDVPLGSWQTMQPLPPAPQEAAVAPSPRVIAEPFRKEERRHGGIARRARQFLIDELVRELETEE